MNNLCISSHCQIANILPCLFSHIRFYYYVIWHVFLIYSYTTIRWTTRWTNYICSNWNFHYYYIGVCHYSTGNIEVYFIYSCLDDVIVRLVHLECGRSWDRSKIESKPSNWYFGICAQQKEGITGTDWLIMRIICHSVFCLTLLVNSSLKGYHLII